MFFFLEMTRVDCYQSIKHLLSFEVFIQLFVCFFFFFKWNYLCLKKQSCYADSQIIFPNWENTSVFLAKQITCLSPMELGQKEKFVSFFFFLFFSSWVNTLFSFFFPQTSFQCLPFIIIFLNKN